MSRRSQRARNATSSQSEVQRASPTQNRRSNESDTSLRSQLSQSLNTENYDQYTIAAVKYILNHSANKFPIKRADIVKECANGEQKIFQTILPVVQEHLRSIYGIRFEELKPTTKSSNKLFICVSTMESVSLTKLKDADRRHQSLLALILSYIYIKGTAITEVVLKTFLNQLGIDLDTEHDYFGDVKKLIDTFHKQLYLSRTKMTIENTNEEKVILGWGERANIEYDKKRVLKATANIFHKPTTYFRKQYMEHAQNEEQGAAMEEG